MNKRRIEKEINKNINIKPDFNNIKNNINFDKYTQSTPQTRKSFNFKWWKIIVPACLVLIVTLFMFKDFITLGTLDNNSSSSNVSSRPNSSQAASVSQSNNDMSNENNSQVLGESTIASVPGDDGYSSNVSSVVSSITNVVPGQSSSSIKEQGPSLPNEPSLPDEEVQYIEQDGYFKNSNISEPTPGYQSYAVFDINKEYNDTEIIDINIFVGTIYDEVEAFDTSIIMYDFVNEGTSPIIIYEIKDFHYDSYPMSNVTDNNGNAYSYFKSKVSVRLDLSLITFNSGEIYIGLNYVENNSNYDRGVQGSNFYYGKENGMIRFSKTKII